MVRSIKQPRSEKEVLTNIVEWCEKKHPKVEVQKSEYEKLIECTGEKKIIDTTLIGRYGKKTKSGAKGCLIAELEFEEHKASTYSILNDMLKITIPLRKLYYWRNDIPQYWIKIDRDSTPFMINFRHIKENEYKVEKMPAGGKWQKNDQITRIITAERESKEDKWPDYVIIGWPAVFKELDRLIKLAKF